jgi:hypothetical protein
MVQRQITIGLACLAPTIATCPVSLAVESAPAPAVVPTYSAKDTPRMLRGLVQASLVGSTFGWRGDEPGSSLFQPRANGDYTNTAYSKFSLGRGYRVGVGGLWRRPLSSLSFSASIEYEWQYYGASYPSNAFGPFHDSNASLKRYGIEFRTILDRWAVKPYIVVNPGWAHLDLPQQEVFWTPLPPYTYHFADAWKSGMAFDVAVGALYEFVPNLSTGLRLGYRRLVFKQSNEGSFGPYADLVESLTCALSVEWWP